MTSIAAHPTPLRGAVRRALLAWVLFVLAPLSGCADSGEDAALPETVLVIALESAAWGPIDELLADGELPHLGRLIREGTRAVAVAPDPLDAPMLWTTAFTGKAPRKHQVAGELANLPDGTRTLVPSGMRATRNLQQIVGSEGRLVASVGIPVTWPAEVVNGFLVAPGTVPSRWTSTDEHTHRREPAELATYPPNLYGEIEPLLRDVDALRREEAARFFTLNETEYAMLYDRPLGSIYRKTNPLRDFGLTHQRDLSYVDVGLHLMERYDPDLVAVHLELLESLQPVYWRFAHPDVYRTPADSRRRFRETVPEAYRFLDEQIGRLVEALPEGSTVIVLSERGFGNGAVEDPEGEDPGVPAPVYTNEAVLVLSGQGIRKGADLGRVDLADLTPTVLALLGVPIGADMDGDVLVSALTPAFEAAHPRRSIDSHDEDWDQGTRYPTGLVDPDAAETEQP